MSLNCCVIYISAILPVVGVVAVYLTRNMCVQAVGMAGPFALFFVPKGQSGGAGGQAAKDALGNDVKVGFMVSYVVAKGLCGWSVSCGVDGVTCNHKQRLVTKKTSGKKMLSGGRVAVMGWMVGIESPDW